MIDLNGPAQDGWLLCFAGIRVLSFDIFDTLLHRRVAKPTEVFNLVKKCALERRIGGKGDGDAIRAFPKLRERAERLARKKRIALHGGEGEVNLSEIYATYADAQVEPSLPQRLMSIELEMERSVLYRSHEGWLRYKAASQRRIPIAFISDMYLPPDWLREVLVSVGYEGAGSVPLFVSGEERLSKRSGTLYDRVGTTLNWQRGHTWLHVGDNLASDVQAAAGRGLRTEWARWTPVARAFP